MRETKGMNTSKPQRIEQLKRCFCRHNREIIEIGNWEHCPLADGGHTEFSTNKCSECGGLYGFPDSNLQLALDEGTPQTKETLRKIMENL